MPQPMPVVREIHWPGVIPQVIAISVIALIVHVCVATLDLPKIVCAAALIYLIICRSLRAIFVRDHKLGILEYRAGHFEAAITHFEASHRFFAAHRWLDRWRSPLMGVASWNPYRVIALANMAYCHAQLGDGAKAIELFEAVLREVPDHTVAKASLNMLRASRGFESLAK